MRPMAVSLHCNRGTSDKVYDMQLAPQPDGTWSVFAQNGRRGARLTQRTKVKGVGYSAAYRVFDEVLDEKLSKGYRSVALSGLSAALNTALVPPTPPSQSGQPAPSWPGADEGLSEVATALQVPLSTLNQPNMSGAKAACILLADLSLGLQDGLPEALSLFAQRPRAIDASLLGEPCQHWYALLTAAQQKDLLDYLGERCAQVVTA